MGIFHWAVTLQEVSLDSGASFENKAPPSVHTIAPIVLYCGGKEAGFTESISLIEDGQSTSRIYFDLISEYFCEVIDKSVVLLHDGIYEKKCRS